MRGFSFFASAAAAVLILVPQMAQARDLEVDVLAEMNWARAHPADYARELAAQARSYDPDRDPTSFGNEDPSAVDEAIDFLRRQPALPPLAGDARLAAAAEIHTRAQGPRGEVGHGGVSLGQRLQREGLYAGLAAEDISYGYDDPREVVRQLIVDSGVANRGHRNNIFGKAYSAAGVSCGPHRTYGSMCVIDFAGVIMARGGGGERSSSGR